jgi:hypothetical protein
VTKPEYTTPSAFQNVLITRPVATRGTNWPVFAHLPSTDEHGQERQPERRPGPCRGCGWRQKTGKSTPSCRRQPRGNRGCRRRHSIRAARNKRNCSAFLDAPEMDTDAVSIGDGGGSGIRTHVTVSRKHAFQACAFSHSATPPSLSTAHAFLHKDARGARFRAFSHSAAPPSLSTARALWHEPAGFCYIKTHAQRVFVAVESAAAHKGVSAVF